VIVKKLKLKVNQLTMKKHRNIYRTDVKTKTEKCKSITVSLQTTANNRLVIGGKL